MRGFFGFSIKSNKNWVVVFQAYDASRLQISEVDGDPDAKSIYSVASRALGVRVQKAVDAEVAALLDDSDASRFASDVEDLEEDFVVQANLPDAEEGVCTNQRLNLNEQSESKHAIDDEAETFDQADSILSTVEKTQNDSVLEKPRVRRLLDEQFDLVSYFCSHFKFFFPDFDSLDCLLQSTFLL